MSVHCLATSLASRVTSSEALAMSLAHWMRARLFPLPPRTRRDISAMSKAIRLAAPMMSFPYEVQQEHDESKRIRLPLLYIMSLLTLLDHLRASSWSCLAATIMGSFTISPAFCSGNSSSFSSGGGGLGGGTSPSGRGGLGGAASSLSYKDKWKGLWTSSFTRLSKFKVMPI